MKRRIILLLIISSFLTAQQMDTITYKICVNAGHGGHDSNDRPPVTPAGFWESEGNLTKALALETILKNYGIVDLDANTRVKFDVVMSRRNNRTQDDLALSSIGALANSNYCDWMHSIHSNAGGGSNAHYTLMLYPGITGDARINGISGYPKCPEQEAMAKTMGPLIQQAIQTASTSSAGDWTFYYGWGYTGDMRPYLGVFRNLQIPGTLSEGTFHDYYPETYRLQNLDFRINEAWSIFIAILEQFELPKPELGNLAGIVRTREKIVNYAYRSGSDDLYEPIDSLKITLYPSASPESGRVYYGNTSMYIDKYTPQWNKAGDYDYYSNGANNNDGNNHKNGFYLFDSLAYGSYTVIYEAPGFWPDTMEVSIDNSRFFFTRNFFMSTSVPPYVKSVKPKQNEAMHPAWEPIVITFSHEIDTASFRDAFTVSPDAALIIGWSNGLKTVTLSASDDTLEVETDYTLTLHADRIRGNRAQQLDGNADGIAGDDYVLVFTTSPPDIYPPKAIAHYPSASEYYHDLQPIISIYFDEIVDEAENIGDKFSLVQISGETAEIDCDFDYYHIDKKTIVSLFPKAELTRQYAYRRYIYSGLKDIAGNETSSNTTANLRIDGSIPWYADTLVIDAFDAGLTTHWKQPGFSGTTIGLLDGSASANTRFVNHGSGSGHSMAIYYKFDPEIPDALLREYLDGASTPAKRYFTNESILQAWVFGDGSGNLFRFAIDDPSGTGASEVSPWYPLDFIGWRLIKWDLRDGETGEWAGVSDGTLNGQLNFDSFQIAYVDSLSNNEGTIYIEDLMVLTPGGVGLSDRSVPDEHILEQNYPNPFNPVTSIRYSIPQAANVELTVYDVNGRFVRSLAREYQNAGVYSAVFDAAQLPSGVYIAQLRSAESVKNIKMLLVK
ncbi:MAG: Ig-like domain-containing protein [Candidatus Marinimicrobia bacterium]|nr:Ig-like domain-containing protein [Candidatus Neomarinimicrobiota bacterium]